MNIDDLIRETVRRQEELAVDPDRVRAALPARAARRRRARTRAMLATVAAAVTVAVAVPVIALRDNDPAVSATSRQVTIPLRYRPTWLPDGMVEKFRGVSYLAPGTYRMWESTAPPSAERSNPNVLLSASPSAPDDVDREPNIDINGTPGYYGGGSVIWRVDGDTKLVVAQSGLTEEDMLRIARSVEPDPTRMRLPLHFGWLPDGSAEWMHKSSGDPSLKVMGDSPTEWGATVLVYDSQRYLEATVGTTRYTPAGDTSHGQTVIINGRTAQLAQPDETMDPVGQGFQTNWVLTMDLGEGRRLIMHGGTAKNMPEASPLSRDDMIRIAEHVQFDPSPDIGWIGR